VRIVYALLTNNGVAGGQKMAVRHVETLNALGFDAVCYADPGAVLPRWFEHQAPLEQGALFRADDVVVVPDDSRQAIELAARSPAARVVVHCQSVYPAAAAGTYDAIAASPERLGSLLCVSPMQAPLLRRLLPEARVELARCFADDRIFRPAAKELVGAYAPRKRPLEAAAIRRLHARLHPDQYLPFIKLDGASEAQVADAFGRAAIHLSLSRLESVGMTTLEAMASGCLCVGFTGIGGRAYATPDNGLWVDEDDCVAAAEALGEAVAVCREGGPRLQSLTEAALETARAWSYAAFARELEDAWMRLAPEARA
jgi:hypothetical protein